MKRSSVFACLAIGSLLAGCASPPVGQSPDKNDTPSPTVPGSASAINVTPFTTLIDQDKPALAAGTDFTNSYTRLRITSVIGQGGSSHGAPLDMRYEPRNWFKRYFWHKEFDANLSTKIRIGVYEVTVPLVTVSHQSNNNGEQWSRMISRQLLEFPLFLVRGDGEASIPVVQVRMSASKEYSSNMAGKALESVLAGIQSVSPDSGVLTRLSAQSVKDKSTAVDVAIGKLFSNGLTEEHVSHRDLRNWNVDGGIRIAFAMPKESDDWDKPAGEVGVWDVSFEEPRPSIFGDWRICHQVQKPMCVADRTTALQKVYQQSTPSQVLNYPLIKTNAELGTVAAFLIQQDWYAKGIADFSGDPSADAALADSMCLKIQNSIVGLGLNSDDADIVTWAFVDGLPWAKKMDKKAFVGTRSDQTDSSCARAVKKIRTART